jgi:hypothetical protein
MMETGLDWTGQWTGWAHNGFGIVSSLLGVVSSLYRYDRAIGCRYLILMLSLFGHSQIASSTP